MQRKNLRSSQCIQSINLPLRPSLDIAPAQEANNVTMGNIYASVYRAYSDQKGKFPHLSARGNQYIFVYYDYGRNIILFEALPNHTVGVLTKAWTPCFTQLQYNGYVISSAHRRQRMFQIHEKAFRKSNVDFQLVPPHVHRRNSAERSMQTFKSHFLASLATLLSDFTMKEWDRLLPHAQLTLNNLQASCRQPTLSAHAAALGT